MSRRDARIGPNLKSVLDRAPIPSSRSLFERPRVGGDQIASFDGVLGDIDRAGFADLVAEQDHEVLAQLEVVCRHVVDLSEDKGATSLDTIVYRKLYNTDVDVYEQQEDALSRSIWVYMCHHDAFQDAQSFYVARRHRKNAKLYSAFEVADRGPEAFSAADIDLEDLSKNMAVSLDQKVQTRATAIDLPETGSFPRSVMIAIRHGGALSSVLDHRDDGLQEPYYYRPGNVAVLIYTPILKQLEVCANGYLVRQRTSDTFARVVLGQDLSAKPLINRVFNLDRFRSSLTLPLPEYEDVEITSANVTELEMRLGNWKRRLLLQVTTDDDIADFADRYMGRARAAASRYGYSRVTIVVAYRDRESGAEATLKLWVSSGNTSNAQNESDPHLRDLGLRLLDDWGLMENQRLLGEAERMAHFDSLLWLYDFSDDDVSGADLKTAGADLDRLVAAQILEKRGRQDVVLIEEDGEVVEGDIGPGRTADAVTVTGSFGEPMGVRVAEDWKLYRIRRAYLTELLLNTIKTALGATRARIVSELVADFGMVAIGTQEVPVQFARLPADLKAMAKLDLEFRRRHETGPGLILTAGEKDFRYLGSNVVVALRDVASIEESGLFLDADALDLAHRSGKALVLGGDAPQVIVHAPRHATLHVPGIAPFNLFAEKQITLFQRLVDATIDGRQDVKTRELMRGMRSKSPMQLFQKAQWEILRDVYICTHRPRTWRLGESKDPPSI